MDKGRLGGAGKQVTGSLKEAVGKVTGDKKIEAEGRAEKKAGEAQASTGRAETASPKTTG